VPTALASSQGSVASSFAETRPLAPTGIASTPTAAKIWRPARIACGRALEMPMVMNTRPNDLAVRECDEAGVAFEPRIEHHFAGEPRVHSAHVADGSPDLFGGRFDDEFLTDRRYVFTPRGAA
jgi:hypothetical protein